MRNFSWKYFSLSGEVESYLLHKDVMNLENSVGEAPTKDQVELDQNV